MKIAHRTPSVKIGNGFTLIELLIAALLLSLVALAALALLSGLTARWAEHAEAAELEQRRSVLYDLIRSDFDDAGRLILPPQRRAPSQEAAVLGLSDDFVTPTTDYYAEEGLCRRLTNHNGGSHAVSARGLYAAGWVQFRPHERGRGAIGFINNDGARHAFGFAINIATGVTTVSSLHTEANGAEREQTLPHTHLHGDRYRLSLTPEGRDQLRLRYYVIRMGWGQRQIGTDHLVSAGPSASPWRVMVQLEESGAEVTDLIWGGSSNGVVRVGQPLLPALLQPGGAEGERLTGAVTIHSPTSVTLLRADPSTDATFLAERFAGTATSSIEIKTPCRGGYGTGDIVILLDGEGRQIRTAVYRVINVEAVGDCQLNTPTRMVLSPSTAVAPAWGWLYSPSRDFLGESFASTTLIAKLSTFTTYKLQSHYLLRGVGGRQCLGAFGVEAFSVEATVIDSTQSYYVSCNIRREGFHANRDSGAQGFTTIRYAASPRALNQQYEYQSIPMIDP